MCSKVVPETHRSQGKLQVGRNQELTTPVGWDSVTGPSGPELVAGAHVPARFEAGARVVTQSRGPVCADKAAFRVLRGERVRPQLRWACTAAW